MNSEIGSVFFLKMLVGFLCVTLAGLVKISKKRGIPICRLADSIGNEVLQAECMPVKYKAILPVTHP